MSEQTNWPIPATAVEGDRQGIAAHVQYWLARGAIESLGALPGPLRRTFTQVLARLATRALARPSSNARKYLTSAYGPTLTPARREELVRAAWRFLALSALEFPRAAARIGRERDLRSFDVHMTKEVEQVLAAKRGALIVAAHLGEVELAPAALARVGFDPFYVVSRPPRNRPLSRYAQRQRERLGYRLIPRHGAFDLIPKILAAGGSVGMLLDQRARGRTVTAPFFGRDAACERSPGILARRCGVPIVVIACVRQAHSGRLALTFPRVFTPPELHGKDPQEIARMINREFEQLILAHPEQYLWLHDRFRESGRSDRASKRNRLGSDAQSPSVEP